jgi:hypothetical protein
MTGRRAKYLFKNHNFFSTTKFDFISSKHAKFDFIFAKPAKFDFIF